MFEFCDDIHCSARSLQPMGFVTDHAVHFSCGSVYNCCDGNRNCYGKPIHKYTFLSKVALTLASHQFIIMQNAITSATQLNIGASIGVEMFAFIWIAAGSAFLAWVIQLGMCCCCASRRDVKTGRKSGSMKAWSQDGPPMREKEPGRLSGTS